MLLYVGGAQLPFKSGLLNGSSLLSPLNPLLLLLRMPSHTLLLLSESSRRGRRKRGEVGLRLTVARVSALSHGEIPERPLLVAAGSLLLGRAAGNDSRRAWTEMVIVANVDAAWCCSHRGD